MSDEARYLRAREVLDGAGWLFDEFVNAEVRKIITSAPDDVSGREAAFTRSRIGTEMKLTLLGIIEEYEADLKMQERRDQLKESRNGRREHAAN